jgi:hypothetical protein
MSHAVLAWRVLRPTSDVPPCLPLIAAQAVCVLVHGCLVACISIADSQPLKCCCLLTLACRAS